MAWLLAVLLFVPHSDFAPPQQSLDQSPTLCGRDHAVKLYYGKPSDGTTMPHTKPRRHIRRAARQAQAILDASGDDTLHFTCNRRDKPRVKFVTLPPIGEDNRFTFLEAYDFITRAFGERPDRLQVVMFDRGIGGNGYRSCGQGFIGKPFSVVACWRGWSLLHEIGHNLGAVQNDAPHSDGSWHCAEGRDVMCYAQEPRNCETLVLDCLGGDYYVHDGAWTDIADSPFLHPR